MKKLFFLVVACVLLILSCRKIYTAEKITTPNEVKIAEAKVRHFLETELAKAKGASKKKLTDVISKIDFSTIRIEPFKHEVFSDITDVILMDLPGINVDDFLNLSKTETIAVKTSSTDSLKNHASITKVIFSKQNHRLKRATFFIYLPPFQVNKN